MEESLLQRIQVGGFLIDCTAVKTRIASIYLEICEKLKKIIEERVSQ